MKMYVMWGTGSRSDVLKSTQSRAAALNEIVV